MRFTLARARTALAIAHGSIFKRRGTAANVSGAQSFVRYGQMGDKSKDGLFSRRTMRMKRSQKSDASLLRLVVRTSSTRQTAAKGDHIETLAHTKPTLKIARRDGSHLLKNEDRFSRVCGVAYSIRSKLSTQSAHSLVLYHTQNSLPDTLINVTV